MPIRKFPFTASEDGKHPRPRIPIKISNTQNGFAIAQWALIDTGADNCCIPAKYADILGFDLKKGIIEHFHAVGGDGIGYKHLTTFEIYDIKTNKIIHFLKNIYACYVENLHVVLFGVNTLNSFQSK